MEIIFKIIIIIGLILFSIMTMILSYYKQQLRIEERKKQEEWKIKQ